MAFNITTGYPMRTGDDKKDLEFMYSCICSLIDELGFIVPVLDTKISAALPASDTTDEDSPDS